MYKISYLNNIIQNYLWGSTEAIPSILGEEPDGLPKAELWMGAHPKAPSMVAVDGKYIPLPQLIEEGHGVVGKHVEKKFGKKLPFLFKVIAADIPLSLQAHPNRKQAQNGFAEENKRSIPFDNPKRNYSDDNHKPEMLCAVTPFWVLADFRDIPDIISQLRDIEFKSLAKEVEELALNQNRLGLRKFFKLILKSSPMRQKEITEEALKISEEKKGTSSIFDWVLKLNNYYPGDIGIVAPLIMNVILLNPGEALSLGAGDFHAYLEGVGIELMANSDNVLRGGLTHKNVDIPELLKILSFNYGLPKIILPQAASKVELTYEKCADEFSLSFIRLNGGNDYTSPKDRSVEIMICIDGETTISEEGDEEGEGLVFDRGKVVIVPASVGKYHIRGEGVIYKASVPK